MVRTSATADCELSPSERKKKKKKSADSIWSPATNCTNSLKQQGGARRSLFFMKLQKIYAKKVVLKCYSHGLSCSIISSLELLCIW